MPLIFGIHGEISSDERRRTIEQMVSICGEKRIRLKYEHKNTSVLITSDISWPQGQLEATSNDGRFHIVFLGELFNTDSEIVAFENDNLTYQSKSFPEIALAAFLSGNKDNLGRLNGEFRFVVHDTLADKLYFVQDRYGFRRFFYGSSGHVFHFSSVIKTFLNLPGFKPELNMKCVSSLMQFGLIIGYDSILKGIHYFREAHVTEYEKGREIIEEKYWNYPQTADPDQLYNKDQAVEQMAHLLKETMQKTDVGNYRKSIQLTGGLDSRALITASDPIKQNFSALTMGIKGCYDIRIASKIAKRYGIPHRVFFLDNNESFRFARQTMWANEGENFIGGGYTYYLGDVSSSLFDVNINGIANFISGRTVQSDDFAIDNFNKLIERVKKIRFVYQGLDQVKVVLGDKNDKWMKWNDDLLKENLEYTHDIANDIIKFMMMFFCRSSATGYKLQQHNVYTRYPFLENDFLDTFFKMVPPELKTSEDLYRRIILKNGSEIRDIAVGMKGLRIDSSNLNTAVTEAGIEILYKLHAIKTVLLKRRRPFTRYTQFYNHSAELNPNSDLSHLFKDLLFSEKATNRNIFNVSGLKALWQRHFNTRFTQYSILDKAASIELFIRLFIEGESPE